MNHFLSIAALIVTSSVTRVARARWARSGLAAVGLMAALSSPAFAQYAFGGGTITLPAKPAAGSIVARSYITPTQLCYGSQCTLTYAELYAYGGATRVKGTPDVPTTVNGLTTRLIVNGQPIKDGAITPNMIITSPIEVQLVANGQTITSGSVLADGSTPSPAYFIIYFGSLKYQIFLNAKIQAINGTCMVPDQTITLPAVSPTKFGGVGSVQGTQNFNISFTSCPPGYNRVGYSLVPMGSETTVAGALPLSADSTTTGVRIRVADTSGTPVTFNTSIKLDAYKYATGGSYSVPYQASYVQTGSTITPGSVSGSMQVLVDYQ